MAMLGALSRLLSWRSAVPPVCVHQRNLTCLTQILHPGPTPSSPVTVGNGLLSRCTPSHWNLQQVRFKKRGMEYQPKFLKRLRTHGWQTRIRTRGGIEIILRRMLKGRKSLSH